MAGCGRMAVAVGRQLGSQLGYLSSVIRAHNSNVTRSENRSFSRCLPSGRCWAGCMPMPRAGGWLSRQGREQRHCTASRHDRLALGRPRMAARRPGASPRREARGGRDGRPFLPSRSCTGSSPAQSTRRPAALSAGVPAATSSRAGRFWPPKDAQSCICPWVRSVFPQVDGGYRPPRLDTRQVPT